MLATRPSVKQNQQLIVTMISIKTMVCCVGVHHLYEFIRVCEPALITREQRFVMVIINNIIIICVMYTIIIYRPSYELTVLSFFIFTASPLLPPMHYYCTPVGFFFLETKKTAQYAYKM